jgi:HK97 family phage prohead protease
VLKTKAFKFDVKANKEDNAGQFTGRASVYGVVDAYNDVVMPGAFDRTLEELAGNIVVLNQHNPSDPIGKASLTDSEMSLNAVGQLVLDLPSAKDAYVRLQNGLIDGISIGYEVTKEQYVGDVRQLQEIKLWEISLVTFPANSFARVTDVKGLLSQLADERLAQLVLEVLPNHEGRREVECKETRQKLSDVVAMIQELLAATDPNSEASARITQQKAFDELIHTIRSLNAAAKE